MTITVYGEGGWIPSAPNENVIEVIAGPEPDPAEVATVNKWRGMGFEDAEIIAMYPHLAYAVQYSDAP